MPSAFDLIDSGGGSGSGTQTDVSFLPFFVLLSDRPSRAEQVEKVTL